MTVGPEGARLTAAGWWCALVSSPVFWFLLLRWLWRHAVWGLLLRDLARLELRLVATHPDGAGGLAFIGQYPNAFAAFVFALSCVLGAAIARALLQGRDAGCGLRPAHGSLAGRSDDLVRLSAAGLLQAPPAAQGGDPPGRQFRRNPPRASGRARTARQQRECRGRRRSHRFRRYSGSLPKLHAAAKKLSTLLIARSAIVPVAAAALLPLVAAGATQLPAQGAPQARKEVCCCYEPK